MLQYRGPKYAQPDCDLRDDRLEHEGRMKFLEVNQKALFDSRPPSLILQLFQNPEPSPA